MKQETKVLGSDQTPITTENYVTDYHSYANPELELASPNLSNTKDSLHQSITRKTDNDKAVQPILFEDFQNSHREHIKSPVADRIVENYINSENKEPNGHCLSVSKGRFEEAYKEVYGRLFYKDLPDSMASKFHTPKQVFDMLYASASDTDQGWRSLPEKYRGKGNAGAIAYAGMGTLVDSSGIWGSKLRPGALMQVWRYKEDYEKVVQGVNVKKLDPYGHSFIFISYVCNEKNEIIGLEIADQGFQSYRPIIPRDYEVWWAVNLSI
jgi:hypothetical protein